MDMALSVERKILVVEMFPCSALVFLCCSGVEDLAQESSGRHGRSGRISQGFRAMPAGGPLLPTGNVVQLFQPFHLWHTVPGSFMAFLTRSQRAASLARACWLIVFFILVHLLSYVQYTIGKS
jgi:hypothetical protein